MKKSAVVLSCLLGASLLGGFGVATSATPTVNILFVNPENPMYNDIGNYYDSVYMTIMDMSLDSTMYEYDKDLVGGILQFFNTEVGNIKSINLSKDGDSIHIEDTYLTKMDIYLNDDLEYVDMITIKGNTPEFLNDYIYTILNYETCLGYDVKETKTVSGDKKITMKDHYDNNLSYILYDNVFEFQIIANPEYIQAKTMFEFTKF